MSSKYTKTDDVMLDKQINKVAKKVYSIDEVLEEIRICNSNTTDHLFSEIERLKTRLDVIEKVLEKKVLE